MRGSVAEAAVVLSGRGTGADRRSLGATLFCLTLGLALGLPGGIASAQPAPAGGAKAAPRPPAASAAIPSAKAPPPAAGPAAAPPGVTPATPDLAPKSVMAKHRLSVFDAYVRAARQGDWKRAATLFDPAALEQLHASFSDVLQTAAKKGESIELLQLFSNVNSVAEFSKQKPVEAFSHFMEGLSVVVPNFKEAIGKARFEYLGEVVEEENKTAHIVYRTRVNLDGLDTSKVVATSMTNTGQGWRLLLDAEVLNFVQTLKLEIEAKDAAPAEKRDFPDPAP